MEAVSNALEYTLAVAAMVTHLYDSHAFIKSTVLRDYFGAASPPVVARMIEGCPVITGFLDESVAKEAGTLPNDEKWPPYIADAELVSLDGESGTIRADVRDDVSVLQAWAVIYKPSYVPPNPDETEEIVREELPTVTLLDSTGTGIVSAVYEGFDEPRTYPIVVYALDGEAIQGRPRAIEIQVGGQQLYLPSVMR